MKKVLSIFAAALFTVAVSNAVFAADATTEPAPAPTTAPEVKTEGDVAAPEVKDTEVKKEGEEAAPATGEEKKEDAEKKDGAEKKE